MAWMAKITGDMTLSVLDAAGFKVLGVEMLRMNTMRADDGGQLLARTLNDLHLLAGIPGEGQPGDRLVLTGGMIWGEQCQSWEKRIFANRHRHR